MRAHRRKAERLLQERIDTFALAANLPSTIFDRATITGAALQSVLDWFGRAHRIGAARESKARMSEKHTAYLRRVKADVSAGETQPLRALCM